MNAADMQKFAGGQKAMGGAAVAGLVGLALTFLGMVIDPRAAMFSYLWAFAYWGGLALASVVLLMIFLAVRAKWMVVLRRGVEVMAVTALPFLALFIPVLLGAGHLYSWIEPGRPEHHFSAEALELLRHKAPYLNRAFFAVRGFGYFALFGLVAARLHGWSVAQDASGDVDLTARQRRLGTGALPFVALAFSFAAFDWLMSLQPLWFSTIFGVYYFAGSFIAALSMLAVFAYRARGKDLFGALMSPDHTASVGKLMLAFTCFWAYIGFSQLLLIWIANLPEEIPFFITRFDGGWGAIGASLIIFHFFVPFGALLSRKLKRDARRLAIVGVLILLIHAVDLYWLIMPAFYDGTGGGPFFHWTQPTAFVGVGGIAIAFAIWRLRGRYSVPVRDPFLADSLVYRQP